MSYQQQLHHAIDTVGSVLLGKTELIRLASCCLLSRGHLLVEDLPGVGKTTLSHALATVFGLQFSRVQFTSDLLPADILGLSLFNRDTSAFEFKPGPIFCQVLLADEINRATPRTQSALLEAMAEGQVTNDGISYPLPKPFFVVATQNPERHSGTFALPESQLDRFSMRLSIGYPSLEAERALLQGEGLALDKIKACMDAETLIQIQTQIKTIKVDTVVMDYILRLVSASRNSDDIGLGLSPRAALTLVSNAKAWAYIDDRDYVRPEDVQAVFAAVSAHRMRDSSNTTVADTRLADMLLDTTSVYR